MSLTQSSRSRSSKLERCALRRSRMLIETIADTAARTERVQSSGVTVNLRERGDAKALQDAGRVRSLSGQVLSAVSSAEGFPEFQARGYFRPPLATCGSLLWIIRGGTKPTILARMAIQEWQNPGIPLDTTSRVRGRGGAAPRRPPRFLNRNPPKVENCPHTPSGACT